MLVVLVSVLLLLFPPNVTVGVRWRCALPQNTSIYEYCSQYLSARVFPELLSGVRNTAVAPLQRCCRITHAFCFAKGYTHTHTHSLSIADNYVPRPRAPSFSFGRVEFIRVVALGLTAMPPVHMCACSFVFVCGICVCFVCASKRSTPPHSVDVSTKGTTSKAVADACEAKGINVRIIDEQTVGLSFGESITKDDVSTLVRKRTSYRSCMNTSVYQQTKYLVWKKTPITLS